MIRKDRLLSVGMLLSVLPAFQLFGQPNSPDSASYLHAPAFERLPEVPEGISFFASLFPPKAVHDLEDLKGFIRSSEFASIRRQYGDLYAVDAIFDHAMRASWNNVYEALIVSLVCTMEHRMFGVRLPLIGPLLWFPLTSEFQEDFQARVKALPRNLYADTPQDPEGDRDKLQHFFGSAFLAYLCESRDSADRVGSFIEWGEEQFIVGGVSDARDMRANRQGEEFGFRLLQDRNLHPSTFFRLTRGKEKQ